MPTLGTLFSQSWKLYKEKLLVMVGIMILPIIITYIVALALPFEEATIFAGLYIYSLENPGLEIPFNFNVIIYFVLFFLITSVMFMLSAIAMVFSLDRKAGVLESYKLAFKKFWSYLWLTVLSSVITIGGFILAIVPGIIFSVWFMFSAFILVNEDKRGMEVLLRSKEYIKGYWWPVLGRFLLLTLIVMGISILINTFINSISEDVDSMVGVIFQLVITPLFIVYIYAIYNQLKKIKPSLHKESIDKPRKFFVFMGVLGLVAPIILIILFFNYFPLTDLLLEP